MLLGYDPLDLVLALAAGFACGFLNTAASSGSVVTLPIMIFLGLDPATANATNRLPVLVGAASGALDFAARKAMPWKIAFRIAVPTTLGSLIGAGLAEIVPRRDMGMVVTAAVLFAALLLFKNIKKAIEQAQLAEVRLRPRDLALFFAGRHLARLHRAGRRRLHAADPDPDGGLGPAARQRRAGGRPGAGHAGLPWWCSPRTATSTGSWAASSSLGSIAGGMMGARLSLLGQCQALRLRAAGGRDLGRAAAARLALCLQQALRERGWLRPAPGGSSPPAPSATCCEWYDFAVYGYFAAAIGRAFFPSEDKVAQVLAAFGIFAVGFLMRPVGGALIGAISAIAWAAAPRSPSRWRRWPSRPSWWVFCRVTDALGLAAPILLTLLRMIQGLSVGGEYTTSIVFADRACRPGGRGLIGALGCCGAVGGILAGSATGAALASVMSEAALESVGLAHSLHAGPGRRAGGLVPAPRHPRGSEGEEGSGRIVPRHGASIIGRCCSGSRRFRSSTRSAST